MCAYKHSLSSAPPPGSGAVRVGLGPGRPARRFVPQLDPPAFIVSLWRMESLIS